MSRAFKALCLTAALMTGLAAVPGTADACPMCKTAIEDDADPVKAARPKAYMYSILFMISMPATLATIFGVSFYRLSRQRNEINESLLSEFDDQ